MAGHLTNKDYNKALPGETAKLFKVVSMGKRTSTKILFSKYGMVDFTTLSVQYAQRLVNKGFPYLEAIPAKKTEEIQ